MKSLSQKLPRSVRETSIPQPDPWAPGFTFNWQWFLFHQYKFSTGFSHSWNRSTWLPSRCALTTFALPREVRKASAWKMARGKTNSTTSSTTSSTMMPSRWFHSTATMFGSWTLSHSSTFLASSLELSESWKEAREIFYFITYSAADK